MRGLGYKGGAKVNTERYGTTREGKLPVLLDSVGRRFETGADGSGEKNQRGTNSTKVEIVRVTVHV
jgi:hypothetical protein